MKVWWIGFPSEAAALPPGSTISAGSHTFSHRFLDAQEGPCSALQEPIELIVQGNGMEQPEDSALQLQFSAEVRLCFQELTFSWLFCAKSVHVMSET